MAARSAASITVEWKVVACALRKRKQMRYVMECGVVGVALSPLRGASPFSTRSTLATADFTAKAIEGATQCARRFLHF